MMSRSRFVLLVVLSIMPGAAASAMGRRLVIPPPVPHAGGATTQSRLDPVARSTARARDADQAFLRSLADHLEAERVAVHAMMSTPGSHASHGTAMDPANWDGTFDSQQREAVALLQHDYREAWSPRAPKGPKPAPASGGDAEALERATMQSLVSIMREGVALTDRYLPRLRRASSRDLARRVRSSHAKLIKELGAMSSH